MENTKYYLFYKPYDVLSQFTQEVEGQMTLADFIDLPKDYYPLGRLDKDSEGLLVLTNDKKANKKFLSPNYEKVKTYWVQVDGQIDDISCTLLEKGVEIKLPNKELYKTLPCEANVISEPDIPQRTPPIRYRANIPTSWLEMKIHEGKNRQIRRMCAAIHFPVLRLIRYSFHDWTIDGMIPGQLKIS